jgi:hypothetical protein
MVVKKKKTVKRKVVKRKVIKKRSPEEPVHVMLQRPLSTRKTILQTAIDAARLGESYKEFKELQIEKKSLLSELSLVVKEMQKIERKFFSYLPKLKEVKQVKVVSKAAVLKPSPKVLPKKIVEVAYAPSEIDRLKTELEDIEKKLTRL